MLAKLANWILGSRVRKSIATSILSIILMGIHWVQSILGVTIPPEVLAEFSNGTLVIFEIILTGAFTAYVDNKIQKIPEMPKIVKK